MSALSIEARLEMLKGFGVNAEYGKHVRDEINSEDEFPSVVPPQEVGKDDAAPYDAGHDAWNSTAHPATSKKTTRDKTKELPPLAPLDCSNFITGELPEESIDFCPWIVIQNYPDQFIGKANRPRAKPFFDKILEGRVWDFFYIYHPEKPAENPRVMVPTVQFEDFLNSINRELGTSLAIPAGANQDRFHLRFGQGDTPRPRYLKRSRDQKVFEVDKFPDFQQEDRDSFLKAHGAIRQDWETLWDMLAPKAVSADKKKNKSRKAAQQKLERERMLHETQGFLHLRGSDNTRAGPGVVFICMDVEAIEMPPNPISEIGIAILDVKDLRGVQPGPSGQNWWQFIKAYHLRTQEYSGLVNHRFVRGCPSYFDFGTSTFPEEYDLPEAIESILEPCIKDRRKLVFVGHDVRQDIKYLSSIGFEVLALQGLVEQLDTQDIHQAWRASEQGKGLHHVLDDLCIQSKHLHNAGNDAVFTLRALIGIAIEEIREREVKARGEEYTPALLGVQQQPKAVIDDNWA